MKKKQVIRITESELRGMIMECLKSKRKVINEGNDASYEVCIKGLVLDSSTIKVIQTREYDDEKNIIVWKAKINSGKVESWYAQSAYSEVYSEDAYDEFRDYCLTVDGGYVLGYSYVPSDVDLESYDLQENLPEFEFDVEQRFGGGLLHKDLINPIVFGEKGVVNTNTEIACLGDDDNCIFYAEINAKGIVEAINDYFNSNELHESRKCTINEASFDARPDFCGIEGIKFIDHGEWADPELKYGNKYINYYDIEDFIIGIMKSDDLDDTDDDLFVETCRNCANLIKTEIEMYGEEREEENFEY